MQENEKENLQRLNKVRLFVVVSAWFFIWLGQVISNLRVFNMLIPITLLQISSFVYLALKSNQFFLHFALVNFVIVSLAMFPSLFRVKQVHWVGAEQ